MNIRGLHLYNYMGAPAVALFVLTLLVLQWRFPLRVQHCSAMRRIARNFLFSIPTVLALRLVLVPIPLAVAWWAQEKQYGLLHWLPLPPLVAGVLGFLLMDYTYYVWHVLTHRLSLLWRLHLVHHTDLDMDVSTAARFHFLDILLSALYRAPVVLLFGISPSAYLIFEIVFEACTQFHHSNWRLPLRLERTLNCVIVTPRMHGIHHSIVERETNSNWGSIFCWWDALHHTLRRDVPQDALTIGLPAYRDELELTLGKLFTLPLRDLRPWQVPDGNAPEREPQPADALAP